MNSPGGCDWNYFRGVGYTYGMSQTILAIYDSGVFRPLQPVELAQGTQVELQVSQSSNERSSDEQVRQAEAKSWSDFVEQTYGSCAGLGLERRAQGGFESREPIA